MRSAHLEEPARDNTVATGRELVPYWLYPKDYGASIERHARLYPLSKDWVRYGDLQRAPGAYRRVFGQPRQDEPRAYLLNSVDGEKLLEYAGHGRIDLAPPDVGEG